MDRPITTLFMLMSLDGKISTGCTDQLDMDADFPRITGLKEGLGQYYTIEQTTDLWSLCSGRVQAKIGVNEKPLPDKTPVSFVLIDNRNLTEHGVRYFCAKARQLVIVTTNPRHPAFGVAADNLSVLLQPQLDLGEMLAYLRREQGCERLTIQSGGTLNGLFLRSKLIDHVDIVVAPVLVGGAEVPTLVDGPSLRTPEELDGLGVLSLESCQVLEGSYLRLRYQVAG